jgi:hypothetical protein
MGPGSRHVLDCHKCKKETFLNNSSMKLLSLHVGIYGKLERQDFSTMKGPLLRLGAP